MVACTGVKAASRRMGRLMLAQKYRGAEDVSDCRGLSRWRKAARPSVVEGRVRRVSVKSLGICVNAQ